MNIQQIFYAVQVYEFRSFTEAAKSLYISQPRLSQAIRELEDELGFEIFQRNRKGISGATVKGYEFIEQSRILLKQFSVIEKLKTQSSSSFKLATTVLSHAQDAFIKLCKEQLPDPSINMDLWFCSSSDAVDRVKSMASDIGVVAIIDDQFADWKYNFESKGIEYNELVFSTPYVTISKNSPLAEKTVISPEDLDGYVYIADNCTRLNDLTLKVHSLLESICPDTRITVSNTDMMYRLAGKNSNGRTFIFEPYPPSAATLRHYGLVTIPFEDLFKAHTGYITLKGQKQSELTTRYIQLLRSEFGLSK